MQIELTELEDSAGWVVRASEEYGGFMTTRSILIDSSKLQAFLNDVLKFRDVGQAIKNLSRIRPDLNASQPNSTSQDHSVKETPLP